MSRGRRRRFASHPSVGTCERCGLGPEAGRMIQLKGHLYHRACWGAEKE